MNTPIAFTGSLIALLAGVAVLAQAPAGDDAGLSEPPRIDPDAEPGESRLEPPPEEREDMLEAVVTRGQTEFRLPDLGTSLRDDEDERDPNQRIAVNFIPLYDPENEDPVEEMFQNVDSIHRVEMLRIFEIGFGGRRR